MNDTTTTRRRQRRHSADELAAMPDKRHAHVALDRCPGLPGIEMHGAHVFRHDADGETLCTRCDLALPHGLCLACGATLYVSPAWGDLRDAANGDSRCSGRLMPAVDQPSAPYTGTAHVVRADDPLAAAVKPAPTTKDGKTPPRPDRDDLAAQPPGIVCVACRRVVYVGEGHAPDCTYKARSIAYNAELHERLLRAEALADAERSLRAERYAASRGADDDGTPRERTPRARRPRSTGGGGIPDDELCEGSGDAVVGPIEQRKFVRAARCTTCGRSVPVSPQDTYRRHRPGKTARTSDGKTGADLVREAQAALDAEAEAEVVDVVAYVTPPTDANLDAHAAAVETPKRTRKPSTRTAKERTPKGKQPSPNEVAALARRTPKAAPRGKHAPPSTTGRKTNGRSALSAKAVVHALVKGAPKCGTAIATITKTSDAVTCRSCLGS